jgi:hypothetical protein
MTQIDIQIKQYGYGWSFKGWLIKLAMVILGLQTLLAVLYLLILFAFGWWSACWGSIAEMLVFALERRQAEAVTETEAEWRRRGRGRLWSRLGRRENELFWCSRRKRLL